MNKHVASAERFFDAVETMFDALEDEIVSRLADAIAQRGAASLIASGGTTPGPLYERLSRADIDWKNVSVSMSDERWVTPDDTRSNERLIRTTLLKNAAAAACLVPLKTDVASTHGAEEQVGAAVSAMPQPFDVTLLGMGADGHTASLFPRAEGLEKALDATDPAMVRAVTPHDPKFGQRMSLTLRAILQSRFIAIAVRGQEKLRAYREAIAGRDVLAMPVRAVLNQRATPVHIYWAP